VEGEISRKKETADAHFYQTVKESEGNKLKLTKDYLHLLHATKAFENTDMIFGDSIPTFLLENAEEGG